MILTFYKNSLIIELKKIFVIKTKKYIDYN